MFIQRRYELIGLCTQITLVDFIIEHLIHRFPPRFECKIKLIKFLISTLVLILP